ncbi:MAG TPA: hypothetical protein VGM90_16545 [Kofleriaceae bacterium]|jgi:hypothetical protein
MVAWKTKSFRVEESGRALYITWRSPGVSLIVGVMLGVFGASTVIDSYSVLDPYPLFGFGIAILLVAAGCLVVAATRRTRMVIVPEQIERHVGTRDFTRVFAVEAHLIETIDIHRVKENRNSHYDVVANTSDRRSVTLAQFEFRVSAEHLRELVETRLAMMRKEAARDVQRNAV